jgi:ABC-2 type transport system permease protein
MSTAFVGALRFEWVRMRSLRATWVLLGLACLAGGLIAMYYAQGVRSGERSLNAPGTVADLVFGAGFGAPASVTALCAGLMGVLAGGQDHRHGTARTGFLAVPRRGIWFAARLTVVAVLAVVAALASAAVALGVTAQRLGRSWDPWALTRGDLPRILAGHLLLTVLTALLGVGLAGLLRGILPAAVLLLMLPLFVEPGVADALRRSSGGWSSTLVDHLPFTSGHQMLDTAAGAMTHTFAAPAFLGAATMWILVLVCVAGAAAALVKRDA